MRNLIIVGVALAAVACGGTSSDLSRADAQSIGDAIAAAMPQGGAGGSQDLTLSSSVNRTVQCAGGGSLNVSGSLVTNCATFYSCSTSGSLSLTANGCATSSGVSIDGSLSSSFSSRGITLSATVSGTLTAKLPDGTTAPCAVNATISGGKVSGSVCGYAL